MSYHVGTSLQQAWTTIATKHTHTTKATRLLYFCFFPSALSAAARFL